MVVVVLVVVVVVLVMCFSCYISSLAGRRPGLISKGNFSEITEPILENEGVLESGRKGLSSGT